MRLRILRPGEEARELFEAWRRGEASDEELLDYAYEAKSFNEVFNMLTSMTKEGTWGIIIAASNDIILEVRPDGSTNLESFVILIEALALTFGDIYILMVHNRPSIERAARILWDLGYVPVVVGEETDRISVVVMERKLTDGICVRFFLGRLSSRGLGKLLEKQFSGGATDLQAQLPEEVATRLFLKVLELKNGRVLGIIWSRGATGDTVLTELLKINDDPRGFLTIPFAPVNALVLMDRPARRALSPDERLARLEGSARLMHKVYAKLGPQISNDQLSLVLSIAADRGGPHKLAFTFAGLMEMNLIRFRASNKIDPTDVVSWIAHERWGHLIKPYTPLHTGQHELTPSRALMGVGYAWVQEKTITAIAERSDWGNERDEFTRAVVRAILNSLTLFYETETLGILLGHEVQGLADAAADLVFGALVFVLYPAELKLPESSGRDRLLNCIANAFVELGITDWRLIWVPLEEAGDMVHVLVWTLLNPLQVLDAEFELGRFDERVRRPGEGAIYIHTRRFRELVNISHSYDTGAVNSSYAGSMPWYHRVLLAIYRRFFGTIWQPPGRRAPFGHPLEEGERKHEEAQPSQKEQGEGRCERGNTTTS